MSTILKALRKLEQEKGEESALPALDAKALVAPGEPLRRGGRPRGWLPLGAALGGLVAVVVAGGWWLMMRHASGAVPARPAPSPAAVAHTAPRPSPPPARPAPPPAPPTAPLASRAQTPPPGVAPAPAAAAPAIVARAPQPAPAAAPSPSVAAASPTAPAPPPAATARRAAPPREAPVARRASPRRSQPSTQRAQVPEVAVIPPAPTVQVDEIVWHPDPTRRVATVRVKGRDAPLHLHEGDAVGTLVVAEIDPGAVIFLDGTARVRKSLSDSP